MAEFNRHEKAILGKVNNEKKRQERRLEKSDSEIKSRENVPAGRLPDASYVAEHDRGKGEQEKSSFEELPDEKWAEYDRDDLVMKEGIKAEARRTDRAGDRELRQSMLREKNFEQAKRKADDTRWKKKNKIAGSIDPVTAEKESELSDEGRDGTMAA